MAAKLLNNAPILLVRDVVAAANHYRDRLGFRYDRLWGEPPDFCILRRDACRLMLSQTTDNAAVRPHWKVVDKMWNVYFWVDDAKALYEEYTAQGATIDYTLHEKPYGCLEFGIQDLDGYDIAFGQNLDPDAVLTGKG